MNLEQATTASFHIIYNLSFINYPRIELNEPQMRQEKRQMSYNITPCLVSQ
jgi:hypothetical protein